MSHSNSAGNDSESRSDFSEPPQRYELDQIERGIYTGAGLAAHAEAPADDSFIRVVEKRVCVRSFIPSQHVSDRILRSGLRVARLAPSAGNLQSYHVAIVRDEAQKNRLAHSALEQMWVAVAPVVLVFLAAPEQSGKKYHQRGRSLFCIQDATIAAAYAQLAYQAAGLGSCWVGAFDEKQVAQIVSCPTNLRPIILMPIGWPAGEAPPRHRRRPLNSFVHTGHVSFN